MTNVSLRLRLASLVVASGVWIGLLPSAAAARPTAEVISAYQSIPSPCASEELAPCRQRFALQREALAAGDLTEVQRRAVLRDLVTEASRIGWDLRFKGDIKGSRDVLDAAYQEVLTQYGKGKRPWVMIDSQRLHLELAQTLLESKEVALADAVVGAARKSLDSMLSRAKDDQGLQPYLTDVLVEGELFERMLGSYFESEGRYDGSNNSTSLSLSDLGGRRAEACLRASSWILRRHDANVPPELNAWHDALRSDYVTRYAMAQVGAGHGFLAAGNSKMAMDLFGYAFQIGSGKNDQGQYDTSVPTGLTFPPEHAWLRDHPPSRSVQLAAYHGKMKASGELEAITAKLWSPENCMKIAQEQARNLKQLYGVDPTPEAVEAFLQRSRLICGMIR